MFDNVVDTGGAGSWTIRTKDGVAANPATDKGKYFCDADNNGDWNTTTEYAAMPWGSANAPGWPKPACVNNKALVKNSVDFSQLHDFGDNVTFSQQVDASAAGVIRDCGECHVGGGAMEYIPVGSVSLVADTRVELRGADALLDLNGTNVFNYFIDQYDEDNDGDKSEVLKQTYADTGVMEMDCLMCHMTGYDWDERTHALREGKFDTSRVVGAGLGTDDYNATLNGEMGTNYGKIVDYDPTMVIDAGDGNATLSTLALNAIEATPPSANCSSCHFDMHKVDWKKRGSSWVDNHMNEVHYSVGCMGCHERTGTAIAMDPYPIGANDGSWTGKGSSTILGHDPTKGGAPFSSLWNKNDKKEAKTCAYCHTDNPGTETSRNAVDPTDAHTAAGLLATLTQNGRDGDADSSHLDIISCDACHTRKLGNGPATGHNAADPYGSMYEWGTGGALVDATGPDQEGRLTDHENLYVERDMEENLTRVWRGNKVIAANVLVTMFWRDKDDTGFDANGDGQKGGMDAVLMTHVRKAMEEGGDIPPLTADGNITAADVDAQRTALFNYLTKDDGLTPGSVADDNISDTVGTSIPSGYSAGKLKLSFMGVPFIANHNTSPAENAFGSGGCLDCHADGAGFYNGTYELKGRDLEITLPAGAGDGTPYTKVNTEKATTNFHPKVFAKGLKERSIPVRIDSGGTTMRAIDRSELLYDSRDVTAIAGDTDPISARIMTNGVVAATRAEIVAELNAIDPLTVAPWRSGDTVKDPVLDMLHDVHLNMETLSHLADPALMTSTVICAHCHGANPDSSSDMPVKPSGTVGTTAGIINADNSFEATISQYITATGPGDEYVTCTTACHHDGSQDGVETAEAQGTYVVARLTATNSRSQNNVITFDASESSCVGTCSFSNWNFSNCGNSIGGNGSDVVVMLDDNAATLCDGNVTVTSSYLGGSPTVVAVEIGADDTVAPVEMVNNLSASADATTDLDAYGNCVPVYTTTLGTATDLDEDMDWSSNVYVYWGDRTRTVTTAVELDNGTVTHEYDDNTTYTIRVSSKDVNWNITNEIVSTTFADNPCTP